MLSHIEETSYNREGSTTLSIEGKTNSDLVFAKHIKRVTKENIEINEYYVKKGTVGADAGHLLNPNGVWFVEGAQTSFDKRSGRKVFEFSKVTKGCFDYYLKFLETKNPAYLRNAEREIQ